MTKKLKWMALIAAVLLVGVAVPGLYAYLTDQDNATNTFVGGGVSSSIIEEFVSPDDMKPGETCEKDVKVQNTGSGDCYVRVKAVFADGDMGEYCEVDWNQTDWIYNSADEYWYYAKALSAGESTTSLLTKVTLKSDTPEENLFTFHIIVYSESVEAHQGQGFTTYSEAWANFQKNKASN